MSGATVPSTLARPLARLSIGTTIPDMPLGEWRACRLADYGIEASSSDLAHLDRREYNRLLDLARISWHRDEQARIRSQISRDRAIHEIEEIATSSRWGARL